jgi:hypothetical protein
MIRFLLVSVTGWVAVLVLGITTALPYLLRSRRGNASLRTRMWPHYWLGYVLVIMALVHSSFVMGPATVRSDSAGIWAATLAMGLLFLQLALGLVLQNGSPTQRQLRRLHFRGMIAIVMLLIVHLWRNG